MKMNPRKFSFLFSILSIVLFHSISVNAQLSIAPTNIFIEENSRFGTYLVINGSEQTQEISINFKFGYNISDKDGNRSPVYDDSSKEDIHSIASSVRGFPQNFTLAPGQRQVVRLRVSPSPSLLDGTYWSRIVTSSTPQSPPVELDANNSVAARIGITVEQITGLFFKKGNVNTDIKIEEIRTNLINDSKIVILTDYSRLGNSPFLGTVTTSILKDGVIVKEGFSSTSIYFDGTHRQELDIEDLDSGNYTVSVKFESQRRDISRNDLILMDPVSSNKIISIP